MSWLKTLGSLTLVVGSLGILTGNASAQFRVMPHPVMHPSTIQGFPPLVRPPYPGFINPFTGGFNYYANSYVSNPFFNPFAFTAFNPGFNNFGGGFVNPFFGSSFGFNPFINPMNFNTAFGNPFMTSLPMFSGPQFAPPSSFFFNPLFTNPLFQ